MLWSFIVAVTCLPGLITMAIAHQHGPAVVTVVVEEGSAAILPCSLSTKENIELKFFNWRKDGQRAVFLYDGGIHYNNGYPGQDDQFIGRVHHFPDHLKFGNASILIRDTKPSDSGNYTCDFTRLEPQRQTFHIQLVVRRVLKDRSAEIPGAAPRPRVRILSITEDRALLQCEVQGASPEPQLQWKDSDGNILPAEEPQVSFRGGRYNVTLQTTVTKTTTNRFHCVVTQEDIGHETYEEIFVNYCVQDPSGPGVGAWIGVWFAGFLTAAVPLAVIIALMSFRIIPLKARHEKTNTSNSSSLESEHLNDEDDKLKNGNSIC